MTTMEGPRVGEVYVDISLLGFYRVVRSVSDGVVTWVSFHAETNFFVCVHACDEASFRARNVLVGKLG